MDALRRALIDADPDLLWKYVLGSVFLAVAALVSVRFLRTSGPAALVTQARAAGIASLLLLIYTIGECFAEGLSTLTVSAFTLALMFLASAGLAGAWSSELAAHAASASRVESGRAGPAPVTSENRRAA